LELRYRETLVIKWHLHWRRRRRIVPALSVNAELQSDVVARV